MKQKLAIIASTLLLTFGFASNVMGQWVFMANPFHLHPHYPPFGGAESMAGDSLNLFAGGYKGLFHSTNNGVTWDSAGFPGAEMTCLLTDKGNIFVGDIGIHRSSDNGKKWMSIDSGTIGRVHLFAKLDTILFANCYYAKDGNGSHMKLTIIRSTDHGNTWTPSDSGAQSGEYISSLTRLGSTLFAGTYSSIIKSTDGGINWIANDTNFRHYVSSLAVSGTSLFAGTDTCIFRSTDGGMHWDTVNKNKTPGLSSVNSIIVHNTTIFAGLYLIQVLRSTDNGTTWYDVSVGLNSGINTLAPAGDFLFAGTNEGIWRRSYSDLADVTEKPILPDVNIFLFPNPTTGIITVHNSSANILHVTVSSILGENVLELTHPNAPEFTLDLSKLPRGIYLGRFVTVESVIARKIIKE